MKKLTIYWATGDRQAQAAIRKRFGITAGTTINGESPAEIRDEDIPILEETARRGYIRLRVYNPRLEHLMKKG